MRACAHLKFLMLSLQVTDMASNCLHRPVWLLYRPLLVARVHGRWTSTYGLMRRVAELQTTIQTHFSRQRGVRPGIALTQDEYNQVRHPPGWQVMSMSS
jgi:hypothetical protein